MECLKGDEPILVAGTLEVGEKGAKIRASNVRSLREVQGAETRSVHFTLTPQDWNGSNWSRLRVY